MKARSLVALLLFIVLATANSGGYRFGDGDQAFYQPATELRLHPELFPRDRTLIESQAKLTIVDEGLAAASRITRLDPPQLFFILYLLTLVATFLAAAQLARVIGLSETATAVFLLLLTLRHRIAKTGANTLEGYMHPRQLAFALGIFALTAAFKRRWVPMTLCWLVAAAIHPTTALWWAMALAVTLVPRLVGPIIGVTLPFVLTGTYMVKTIGLPVMDAQWVKVLDNKDYLFASGWPAYAWVLNLAYLPLIWVIGRQKQDERLTPAAIVLFASFVVSYPFTEAHAALAVQLQVSRVFWLMDVFLAALVAWLLIDSRWAAQSRLMRQMAVAAVLLLSIGRGIYTLNEAHANRAIVQVHLRDDDWTEAMAWIRTQPTDWLVMAHPDHAWLYGSSVRVSASRDVIVESVKDSAISMYDRNVAMRTAERLSALGAYDTLTTAQAVALGERYGAAVAVTETAHPLELPLLHRNATFAVYDLRAAR